MPRLLLVFIALVLGAFAFGGLSIRSTVKNAFAQVDSKPPHLVSIGVETEFVDTSVGQNHYVTVTIHITDDISGVQVPQIRFARYSQSGTAASPLLDFGFGDVISETGTITDYVFLMRNDLPPHSAEGRWYLYDIYLRDRTGNDCYWSREQAEGNKPECAVTGDLPYFVNGSDGGPPATPTTTPTITPDYIATAVVATLTAIAQNSTPEPCEVYMPNIEN